MDVGFKGAAYVILKIVRHGLANKFCCGITNAPAKDSRASFNGAGMSSSEDWLSVSTVRFL
jgi:hypothetical protein